MRYARNVRIIATELQKRYKDCHKKKINPLNELLLILCSVKRSEKVYLRAFKSLKQAFPTYRSLNEATIHDLREKIMWGGLQNQKARALKKIVSAINDEFGKPTLAPLYQMSDYDCEAFLCSLPGVGKKVARCVMLYSLNRAVFPVDSHCWRISKRLGWIKEKKSCTPTDMDTLQAMIPPKVRLSLHVNMVSLGRSVCRAHRPRCGICDISTLCLFARSSNYEQKNIA